MVDVDGCTLQNPHFFGNHINAFLSGNPSSLCNYLCLIILVFFLCTRNISIILSIYFKHHINIYIYIYIYIYICVLIYRPHLQLLNFCMFAQHPQTFRTSKGSASDGTGDVGRPEPKEAESKLLQILFG